MTNIQPKIPLGQRTTSHGSGANSKDHNMRCVPLSEKLNSNV